MAVMLSLRQNLLYSSKSLIYVACGSRRLFERFLYQIVSENFLEIGDVFWCADRVDKRNDGIDYVIGIWNSAVIVPQLNCCIQ